MLTWLETRLSAPENGATFVTRDRGFTRFPGLRLLDPLAA